MSMPTADNDENLPLLPAKTRAGKAPSSWVATTRRPLSISAANEDAHTLWPATRDMIEALFLEREDVHAALHTIEHFNINAAERPPANGKLRSDVLAHLHTPWKQVDGAIEKELSAIYDAQHKHGNRSPYLQQRKTALKEGQVALRNNVADLLDMMGYGKVAQRTRMALPIEWEKGTVRS